MSIQAKNAALEWGAYRDQETYHALRDGPRRYKNKSALKTLRLQMSGSMIDASEWLVRQFEAAQGLSSASGERVDGGSGNGAETSMLARTEGVRASEAALQAVAIRSLERRASALLTDICRHLLTLDDIAHVYACHRDTAAKRSLSVLGTLADYREDCIDDVQGWRNRGLTQIVTTSRKGAS